MLFDCLLAPRQTLNLPFSPPNCNQPIAKLGRQFRLNFMLRTFLSLFALILCLNGPAWAADPTFERYQSTQVHMGTDFAIVLYARNQTEAARGFEVAFARIKALDERLSDYKSESELSRLSQAAPTKEPVPLSDDLFRVLNESRRFSEMSDGAFDITVGPLTKLWRRSKRQKELPTAEALAAARNATGHKNLVLDSKARTAELRQPGMRLDLGGIGQGFAADEALVELRKLGITRALINASGDIMAGDAPPGEAGWKIGIAPLKANEPPSRFVLAKNCAVSTSGDAFQFVEIGGRRYSHIIDPRTGLGLADRSSVTIIAPNCTTADALATAVCVLGPDKGLKLVEATPELACLFVYVEREETRERASSGFGKYVAK